MTKCKTADETWAGEMVLSPAGSVGGGAVSRRLRP